MRLLLWLHLAILTECRVYTVLMVDKLSTVK